jgi:hypothetical protein
MNFRLPLGVGHFFTNWRTVGFAGNTVPIKLVAVTVEVE